MAKAKHPLRKSPKEWDIEKATDYIFSKLSCTDMGLGQVLNQGYEEGGGLPTYSTIMRWVADNPKIQESYAHARAAQMDWMQHNLLETTKELAYQPVMVDGLPLIVEGKQVSALSTQGVQLAKLYTDNMKWTMSKVAPAKYGDKLDLNHSGEIKLTDEQLESRLTIILGKAGADKAS